MLILTRKSGESIFIGDTKVTVTRKGNAIKVAVIADPGIPILRAELYERKKLTN